MEDWWLGDYESARAGAPSSLVIEAVEPSRVVTISYRDHDLLLERIPGYAPAFALGLQRRVAARDRWILGSMKASAASYLGLTPETLSRVRRRIASSRPRGAAPSPAAGRRREAR